MKIRSQYTILNKSHIFARMQMVRLQDLGIIDYKDAWDLQEKLFSENVNIKLTNRRSELSGEVALTSETQNYLLLCQHPHVYTIGKSGDSKNLLLEVNQLQNIDASFYPINRGGDITYHGLGQIVGYPIFDLDKFYTDIHRFLRELEEVIILTLNDFNIHAGRIDKLTGVWLNYDNQAKARKICAMGIRCSRWITMHGFALNVNTDLSYFNHIVPCGITDKKVTSMKEELGAEVNLSEVQNRIKHHFRKVFSITFDDTPL